MKKLQILLVEDNPEDAKIFYEHMEIVPQNEMWEVHHVCNGWEASQFLTRTPPYENAPPIDLIFLDFNMPRMNGEEMLVHIKPWWKGHPVIVFLTGYGINPTKIREIYELGVSSFVQKPSTFEEFQKVVNYWMDCVKL